MGVTVQIAAFKAHQTRARDLVGLGQSVGSMTYGLVDASDLYRAALVQTVSSMDHYFHTLVLSRACDILVGRLERGATTRFGLSVVAVSEIIANTSLTRELTIRSHLAEALTRETFQRPDDISQALSMVGIPSVWKTVFGVEAGSVKSALGVTVHRRNRIVHQCDADPLRPGEITELLAEDALSSIGLVDRVVEGIDAFARH